MKYVKHCGMFIFLEMVGYYLFKIANVHFLWHIICSIGCLMWYFAKMWEDNHE